MGWVGGGITFIFLWAFCLLVVLPRGERTQAESGEVEPGTPPGAPARFRLGRKLLITTGVTTALWLVVFVVVERQLIGFDDFDFITPKSIRDGAG